MALVHVEGDALERYFVVTPILAMLAIWRHACGALCFSYDSGEVPFNVQPDMSLGGESFCRFSFYPLKMSSS